MVRQGVSTRQALPGRSSAWSKRAAGLACPSWIVFLGVFRNKVPTAKPMSVRCRLRAGCEGAREQAGMKAGGKVVTAERKGSCEVAELSRLALLAGLASNACVTFSAES